MNREMGAGGQVLAPERLSMPWGLSPGAPISRSTRAGLLSDIPAGQSRVGVVSAHNRNAATVTQAGGDECALPAFFAQAPAGKRAGTEEPASGEALRVSETLGGVLGPVGGF